MKSVLVLGASSGIGSCLTNKLLDGGYRVFGTYFKNKVERIASTHPISRIGQPQDIVSIAYHILTESSWMTGQVIKVDGGKSKLL